MRLRQCPRVCLVSRDGVSSTPSVYPLGLAPCRAASRIDPAAFGGFLGLATRTLRLQLRLATGAFVKLAGINSPAPKAKCEYNFGRGALWWLG